MTAPVSRRSFLAGVSAIALAASTPAAAAIGPATAVGTAPISGKSFVVGTPGEFDAANYIADTARDAFLAWADDRGVDLEELVDVDDHLCVDEYVTHVPEWDGRTADEIMPADWLRAGFGYLCNRCGNESTSDDARAIMEFVVCHDCMTPDEYARFYQARR